MLSRMIALLALAGAMVATGAAAQPAAASGNSSTPSSNARGANEPVTLVVHGAKDCPVCKL